MLYTGAGVRGGLPHLVCFHLVCFAWRYHRAGNSHRYFNKNIPNVRVRKGHWGPMAYAMQSRPIFLFFLIFIQKRSTLQTYPFGWSKTYPLRTPGKRAKHTPYVDTGCISRRVLTALYCRIRILSTPKQQHVRFFIDTAPVSHYYTYEELHSTSECPQIIHIS